MAAAAMSPVVMAAMAAAMVGAAGAAGRGRWRGRWQMMADDGSDGGSGESGGGGEGGGGGDDDDDGGGGGSHQSLCGPSKIVRGSLPTCPGRSVKRIMLGGVEKHRWLCGKPRRVRLPEGNFSSSWLLCYCFASHRCRQLLSFVCSRLHKALEPSHSCSVRCVVHLNDLLLALPDVLFDGFGAWPPTSTTPVAATATLLASHALRSVATLPPGGGGRFETANSVPRRLVPKMILIVQ